MLQVRKLTLRDAGLLAHQIQVLSWQPFSKCLLSSHYDPGAILSTDSTAVSRKTCSLHIEGSQKSWGDKQYIGQSKRFPRVRSILNKWTLETLWWRMSKVGSAIRWGDWGGQLGELELRLKLGGGNSNNSRSKVRTERGATDLFRIGKGIWQAAYYQSVYLTYLYSTSCEMLEWMNHKLESRLPGEITTTSYMQMISL